MSDSVDLDSLNATSEQDEHSSKKGEKQCEERSLIGKIRSLKKWKKLVLYSFVLLCVLYLVSLLVINGSWFKSKITKKLEQKSGLEWQVGSIYWVPFGDVYLNDASSVVDDGSEVGGITIDSITVSPSWKSMLSGTLVWNDILLDGVVVDVEKQWLEQQMRKGNGQTLPELRIPAPPRPPQNPGKKNPPIGKTPQGSTRPVKPIKPVVVEKKQEQQLEPIIGPTRRFRLKNCQIRVRNQDQVYFELKDFGMDIPFSGDKQAGAVTMLGNKGEKLKIPVEWDKTKITVLDRSLEWQGVKFQLQSIAQPLGHSVPFQFEIILTDQALSHTVRQPNLQVAIKAEHLRGKFLLRGNLLSPQTWSGIGGLSMANFTISEIQKTNQSLHFDRVYTRARVLQGNLLIEDAQAQSEEISFMANGVVTKHSYAFGVLRCVVNEEYRKKLDAYHHGSRVVHVKYKPHSIFENLGTPDRKYFDLRFDGKLLDLQMKHNRSDQWQSVKQAVKELKQFKNNELREDGLFLLNQ